MKTRLLTKAIIAIPIITLITTNAYSAVSVGGDQDGAECQTGWVTCDNATGDICCAPNRQSCDTYCESTGGGTVGGGTGTSAGTCTSARMCSGSEPSANTLRYCRSSSSTCYGDGYRYYSCSSCNSGYDRVSQSVYLNSPCNAYRVTVYVCEASEPPCTLTCPGYWENITSSYQGYYSGTVTSSCTCSYSVTRYRCRSGYYGSGTSCTACPSGGTSSAGSTSISRCYVTSGSDSTGRYTYTSPCYWG